MSSRRQGDRAASRFTGDGNVLKGVVLTTIALIVLALLAMAAVVADRTIRWWQAPIPTLLPRDLSAYAVPPAPIGNVGAWVPADAYPPAARRAGEQGRVVVALLIDAEGNASACEVTQSSGSSTLDAQTCRLFVRNGRFSPARDRAGRPIPSRLTMPGIRWQLQD